MDIQGRTVLVLGGWGLVGTAICRKLMEERPKKMIVTSLTRREALEAVSELRKLYPETSKDFFVPWWGNIFVREELKDWSREEILSKKESREKFITDIIDELESGVLKRSSLYKVLQKYKPHIVVDCVNSATAIAYQDIFHISRETIQAVRAARRSRDHGDLLEATERLLCTLYIPQLIRHVQIIYRSMNEAKTRIYVKIGTSGTGGMGLNIPYTHSEEKPSRVLLSKSAVAGAHTLLLFLMGRTPDGPITKEIKPTAAIAWKRIGFGEIRRRGNPISLVDCTPEKAERLTRKLVLKKRGFAKPTGKTLHSVFIDTGENGFFSRGEFEAISTPGQMEFVTPEEIANSAVFEIKAGNTGHDIINALDNAALSPTYRAGFMFNNAMTTIKKLEEEHGVDSVAFEMLGPPRLSKLLYEAYLLKRVFHDLGSAAAAEPKEMSRALQDLITHDADLRSNIVSIGIPILLPNGKSLLRGNEIKIPAFRGINELPLTAKNIDVWAHDGWVDLRVKNMILWRNRMKEIVAYVDGLPSDETSSRSMHNREYWKDFRDIDPGKICGWLFTFEEKGKRMKA